MKGDGILTYLAQHKGLCLAQELALLGNENTVDIEEEEGRNSRLLKEFVNDLPYSSFSRPYEHLNN